jgi:ABC-type nitrate/sulfonate/bicarbonate transport system substrate-binding protein
MTHKIIRIEKKVMALFLAGLFCLISSWSWGAGKPEMTKLEIGTASDPNLGTELIIAREKGFFKEVGLDITVRYFPSGGDLSAAIAGGSLFIGSGGSTPSTTLRAAPFPVKILAQQADISGAQQLIVQKEIKKLEDLYGKKIGLMKGTASEILVDSIVQAYKLDPKKFIIVSMGPTEMLTSFARKDVDAVALWEPHTTRARQAGGHILVSGTHNYMGEKPIPNRIYGDHSVLFATEKLIKENPNTVAAILEALARSVEFIEKNRGEALKILATEFKMSEKDMDFIISPQINIYKMVLDKELVSDLNVLADFLFRVKKINTRINAEEWIDPEPLRKVRPQWVTIK